MIAPLACALLASLLYLAAWWYARDGARLEAPHTPDASTAEACAWAEALDASLETPREHVEAVLMRHGVVACPWAPPAALLARLGMAMPMRIAASHVPLN